MNMKKVFTVLLSAVLILSMISVVSAAGTTQAISLEDLTETNTEGEKTDSFDATVSLTLNELFTVTLPASFELTLNDAKNAYTDKQPLSIDVTRLDKGHNIDITVSSPNFGRESIDDEETWTLVQKDVSVGEAALLPYKMGIGGEDVHIGDTNNDPITMTEYGGSFIAAVVKENVASDATGDYIHVMMSVPGSNLIDSAVYEDTLTFTVTVDTTTTP